MSTRTAYPARPGRGLLRSPLAAAPHSPSPEHRPGASPDRPAAYAAVPDPRPVTLDEFDEYLRTVNDGDGRPYEEATIHAYVYPAKALDAWMTANGLDGDFTAVDVACTRRQPGRPAARVVIGPEGLAAREPGGAETVLWSRRCWLAGDDVPVQDVDGGVNFVLAG